VRVRLPKGFRPRAASLAMAGRKAKIAVRAGWARFALPRLEEYELVVLR
jgi:hypothetical protein